MAFFRQEEVADFKGIMKSFPDFGRPSALLHQAVMRAASQFSLGERELIAAFTSALNACDYCVAEHSALAESFGVAPGLLEELQADIGTAPVREAMKPVLRFVRKLTLTPARMEQHDADAVFAAGWNDESLFFAAAVCAMFCMDNRMIQGLGVPPPAPDVLGETVQRLHDQGYASALAYIDGKV